MDWVRIILTKLLYKPFNILFMKFKSFFLLVVFFLITGNIYSQKAEALKLTRNDLPGMEETRMAVYNENSLWGYINGGADLYFEYGFSEMLAQDFVWESEPFRVDAYLMNSPEAAFGIFSVSRHSCKATGKLGVWDCVNPYQVQVALGNIYLSVIAFNGTERSMDLAVKIASKLLQKTRGKTFELPKHIPQANIPIRNQGIKLITGELAMQNSYVSLERAFASINDYKVWVLPVDTSNGNAEIVFAEFSSSDDMEKVREAIKPMIGKEDGFVVINNSNSIIALRGINPEINSDLYNQLISLFNQ